MKKKMFFLLAVVSVAAFSCKRTDEVSPAPQTVDQPNDSLKIQNTYLTSTVIAGSYNHSGSTNGTGSMARFNYPSGIFTKSDGSLLVADLANNAIRKISTANMVTTPYHSYLPLDVAALADGAVGVVRGSGDGPVTVFDHGTQVTLHPPCICEFAGIDKNQGSTLFWVGQNEVFSGGGSSMLLSFNKYLGPPLPGLPLTNNIITSFSIAANDNKFFTTLTKVFERTHSGVIFLISSGFLNLTSIRANHDGSKLYVADQGSIKLITRTPTFKPVITLLVKGADAYGLALSNNEKTLYFTNQSHHTVNKVALP